MRGNAGAQEAPRAQNSLAQARSYFARVAPNNPAGPSPPMLKRGPLKFSGLTSEGHKVPAPPPPTCVRRKPRPPQAHPPLIDRGTQRTSATSSVPIPCTGTAIPSDASITRHAHTNPSLPADTPSVVPMRSRENHSMQPPKTRIVAPTVSAQTIDQGSALRQPPKSTMHTFNRPQLQRVQNVSALPLQRNREQSKPPAPMGSRTPPTVRRNPCVDTIDLSSPRAHDEPDEIEDFTGPDTQVANARRMRQPPPPEVMVCDSPAQPPSRSTHDLPANSFVTTSGTSSKNVSVSNPPVETVILDSDDQLFAEIDVDSMIAESTRQPEIRHATSHHSTSNLPVRNEPASNFSAAAVQTSDQRSRGRGENAASLKRRIIALHNCLYQTSSLLALDIDPETIAVCTKRQAECQAQIKELTEKLRAVENNHSSTTPVPTAQARNRVAQAFSPVTPETNDVPRPDASSVAQTLRYGTSRSEPNTSNIALPQVDPQYGNPSGNVNITNNYFPPPPQPTGYAQPIAVEAPRTEAQQHNFPLNGAAANSCINREQRPQSYQRPENIAVDVDALDPRLFVPAEPPPAEEVPPPGDDEELPMAFTPTEAPRQGMLREIQGTQGGAQAVDEQEILKWRDRPEKKFPWSFRLAMENRNLFGNPGFRPNQREAMNAALSGRNVFVLMPTGGGKSLCYQLPAMLADGVTIVVSPLVSLIQDQVDHLWSKQIPCGALTSGTPARTRNELMKDLHNASPMSKLIYVTPEKITRSQAFFELLSSLSKRKLLQRFVIDEAHCVSQWGHDFRPDYKQLAIFKQKFPDVPIMALTATATPEVREDIKVQLRISRDCVMFKQSFNRTNLVYEVRKKTKNVITEIATEINTIHQGEAGIVYCFSQKDCVHVAEKLVSEHHLRALPYHAGLNDELRRANQTEWSSGNIQIICSTLAFGMGIDKSNVRFVYHHTMPKNVEGYYQESGRAGRDGQPSRCVLYFSMADRMKVLNMILQDAPGGNPYDRGRKGNKKFSKSSYDRGTGTTMTEGQVLRNTQGLARMTAYCLNDIECRRTQLLKHFDEKFDSSKCNPKCDNCKNTKGVFSNVDVTDHALAVVELVRTCTSDRKNSGQSAAYIVEMYMGRKSRVKKSNHVNHKFFGGGKGALKDNEIYRIIEELLALDIFHVSCEINAYGGVQSELLLNTDENALHKLKAKTLRVVLQSRVTNGSGKAVPKRPRSAPTAEPTPKKSYHNEIEEIEATGVAPVTANVTYTSPYFPKSAPTGNRTPASTRRNIGVKTRKVERMPNVMSGPVIIDDDDDLHYTSPSKKTALAPVPPSNVPRAQSVLPPPPPISRSRKRKK